MTWREAGKMRQAVLAGVVIAISSGCLTFNGKQQASCVWLEVTAPEDVFPSGARRLVLGHVGSHMCGSMEFFTLTRSNYVVEMWNSDEVSPVIFLRVRDLDGRPLRLASPDIESTGIGGAAAYRDKGMQYQYVFRGHTMVDGEVQARAFPYELSVRIESQDGGEMGRATLTIVKKAGHYYFSEI